MKIGGKHYRTIWPHSDGASVEVIDQTLLPHEFVIKRLTSLSEAAEAIRSMVIRGAPLAGVTAAYGLRDRDAFRCFGRRNRASLSGIASDPPHRGQPSLGA